MSDKENGYIKVTEDFYNLFKGVHETVYNGEFVHHRAHSEYLYRGYRVIKDEPIDLLGYVKEEKNYRIRKDIADEFMRLQSLLGYKVE